MDVTPLFWQDENVYMFQTLFKLALQKGYIYFFCDTFLFLKQI